MSVATNATKAGWPMSGSPALKIVRHTKPSGDAMNRQRLAGGGQSNAKPSLAGNEPPPFTMTDAEIARELRLSAKTIGRMNTDGKLPQPVVVGARTLRWVRQTIVEWLAAGLVRIHRLPRRCREVQILSD